MKNSPSIAIITCWYGDYPWYFPYFVKSCKYNPSIDFIIVTDNKNVIPEKPDNIKAVSYTHLRAHETRIGIAYGGVWG